MKQAIEAYRHITVTPEFREAERLRAKARHDEAQALHHARREGSDARAISIAKMLLDAGDSVEKIVRITGLTRNEVESLCDKN